MLEFNAYALPDTIQTIEDQGSAIGAELLVEELAFVDADFGGGGIEVERVPGCGEGVGATRMRGFVEIDGAVELVLTDIAPGANGVGDNGDGEVCHLAERPLEGQDGLLVKSRQSLGYVVRRKGRRYLAAFSRDDLRLPANWM